MLEVRKATIDSAANSRLDAIRASMAPPAAGTPSLEKGAAQEAIESGAAGSTETPGVNTQKGQESTPPTA